MDDNLKPIGSTGRPPAEMAEMAERMAALGRDQVRAALPDAKVNGLNIQVNGLAAAIYALLCTSMELSRGDDLDQALDTAMGIAMGNHLSDRFCCIGHALDRAAGMARLGAHAAKASVAMNSSPDDLANCPTKGTA